MVSYTESEPWRVLSATVKGATHKRQNLPNQDSLAVWQPNPVSLPIILAIADGHGNAKSFRSDIGSRLATETAITLLKGLVDQKSDLDNLSAVEDYIKGKLKEKLVTDWIKVVEEDFVKHKFTDNEFAKLEEKDGKKARQPVEDNPLIAYGATLLAVLITEDYHLYLQLGDGDILCVDTYGETTRPLRKDENLIANETYSLCMKNAWGYLEHRFVKYSPKDNRPMILVSTDGYANSFEKEDDFIKIGHDYLEMIRHEGCDEVEKQLENILSQTSSTGSGDDLTFGIIKKIDSKDAADGLENIKKLVQYLLKKIEFLEEGLKDTVKKNDVQQFVNILTQLSEASYSHIEAAVKAYTSSLENWQNYFVDTTKVQYKKFEDLEKRLENALKEESQALRFLKEEQEKQVAEIKDKLGDNQRFYQQITWLKGGLIATISLLIINLGVNIVFGLLPETNQKQVAPASTKTQ